MLVLTTPPAQTGLTTLSTVQAELGAGSSQMQQLRLIQQASAACEKFCGQTFGLATWTETFFDGAYPLLLSRTPVVAATSVTENGSALTTTDYHLDPEAGIIYRPGAYAGWCGVQIAIVYQAGYVLPGAVDGGGAVIPRTLPADIERACLEIVKALWFASGDSARDPAIRSDTVDGVGTTSYLDPQPGAGGLPPLAATLLAPYQRIRL